MRLIEGSDRADGNAIIIFEVGFEFFLNTEILYTFNKKTEIIYIYAAFLYCQSTLGLGNNIIIIVL